MFPKYLCLGLLFLVASIQADHDPEKIKQEVLKLLTKSQKEGLVSHFFEKAESVATHDEKEKQTRNKRLLGVEIKHSFYELVQIVTQIIKGITEKFKGFGSLYQNVGDERMELLESSLTILFGKNKILRIFFSSYFTGVFLALVFPNSALIGTLVYYVLAGISTVWMIVHR